jgi:polyphosphate kinase
MSTGTLPRTAPGDKAPRSEGEDLPALDAPGLYFNRELSMLDFNRRVLEEALDAGHPLLERLKFLAIFSSNLDEFFMVRVSGLKQQIAAGITEMEGDRLPPGELLAAIRRALLPVLEQQRALLREELIPQLARHGILLLDYAELNPAQRFAADGYFEREVFPVLTPLAVDPGHPFPHISNLSMNLAVIVRAVADPATGRADGEERFARIKVPTPLPRLVPVPADPGQTAFTWIEQVIANNLEPLFPRMQVVAAHPFRVTRNADVEIQEDEGGDLLSEIEESVRQRHFGFAVRLAVSEDMPVRVRDILMRNLKLDPGDVYVFRGPLGLSSLLALHRLERPELKDPLFTPRLPRSLAVLRKAGLERESGLPELAEEFFSAIRRQDILLHHPYDSFLPVVDFIRVAAVDPGVVAIKQTLYRVGTNSPVVRALMKARESHKQVAALVELKARFDEESNIAWARALERRGVHVVYGMLGLKTHCKVALVVRKEPDGLRRYVHLGTGNYNVVTSTAYTDIGLLTCDPDFGADVTDLFNYLTGYSLQRNYRRLLVAPVNMRERMLALIDRETAYGHDGHLIFKMNALTDDRIIKALYRASQAGVRVDLLVRGMCCLRPGVPGVSDNIRVISIVGRFLEHSRIYWFRNGGDDDAEVYLGSADMMPRNLIRRVEVLFPVLDPSLRQRLREVLDVYLADNVKARILQPDGAYARVSPAPSAEPLNSQTYFLPQRR